MNSKLILGLILLITCVVGVFVVKYNVHYLKKDLTVIRQQIIHDREIIRVLEAEWEYLNQPERLQKLVDQHLNMEFVLAKQVKMNEFRSSHFASNQRSSRAHKRVVPTLKPILSSMEQR